MLVYQVTIVYTTGPFAAHLFFNIHSFFFQKAA